MKLDCQKFSVIVTYITDNLSRKFTMNRKLHNTLIAALSSGSLLVFALLIGTPADRLEGNASPFASTVADTTTANAATTARTHLRTASAGAPLHRTRQSVRMPFFSFLPQD